jgi:hypothetical protein
MTPITSLTKVRLKKNKTTNALALVVFLLFFLTSTLSHANHIVSDVVHAEQQECYICHQGLDTPPEFPEINQLFIANYGTKLFKIVIVQLKANNFIQPPLRAPPVFQSI